MLLHAYQNYHRLLIHDAVDNYENISLIHPKYRAEDYKATVSEFSRFIHQWNKLKKIFINA